MLKAYVNVPQILDFSRGTFMLGRIYLVLMTRFSPFHPFRIALSFRELWTEWNHDVWILSTAPPDSYKGPSPPD